MKFLRRSLRSGVIGAILALAAVSNAQAVPSFARQTGQACVACHISWPELTPYGRYFKLSGYTLGRNLWVEAAHRESMPPVSVMAQAGITWVDKPTDANGNSQAGNPNRNGDLVFSGGSVFLAGKFTDYLGMFSQFTLDTLAEAADGQQTANKGLSDNTDVRAVYQASLAGKELILGLNLNNNPTVQDPSNSTPAWGFPFTSSPLAGNPAHPDAAPQITALGETTAGYGAYFYWDKLLYGEFSLYRPADGIFSWMSVGNGKSAVEGSTNPYWRLFANKEWGPHNVLVGTYGMRVDILPDPTGDPSGPTDRYTDWGFDAQYQYITDPHVFTAHANYIHEKQDLNATFAAGGSTNSSDHLNLFALWGTYYYQRKYGGTAGYFTTGSSSDPGLYGVTPDAITGFPVATTADTSGYMFELDWLPFQNVRSDYYSAPYNSNTRVMLQYVAYTKVNGASSNIDGFGRSPSANNSLFLNLWVAF